MYYGLFIERRHLRNHVEKLASIFSDLQNYYTIFLVNRRIEEENKNKT